MQASAPLTGDLYRRRATRALLVGLLGLPVCWLLFSSVPQLWAPIAVMKGGAFVGAAALLGAALAVAPILTGGGWLLALWFGVESVFKPRSRATPGRDKAIVAAGLLAWFTPTAGLLITAVQALINGRVHFPRPARDYERALDPIPYWQSIGFWIILAAVLAVMAWRYWQPRLRPQQSASS